MEFKDNDPRGPRRTITAVAEDPKGGLTQVTLDCGHTRGFNQIFPYKPGDVARCYACRTEAKAGKK